MSQQRRFIDTAVEIGALVTEKDKAYGSSFAKAGDFLRLLYPNGLRPEQYGDALLLVRIFDKQMRIATAKDALGENPYRDIAGYGLLGATPGAKAADERCPICGAAWSEGHLAECKGVKRTPTTPLPTGFINFTEKTAWRPGDPGAACAAKSEGGDK